MPADSVPSSPTCYFSIPISPSSALLSTETPTTSPSSSYCSDTYRGPPLDCHMSSDADTASLLQLQTAAVHRPSPKPLSPVSSNSSTDSSSSSSMSPSMSPTSPCCSRCRRESLSGIIQFGTNIYYCSHCARMTGYCAGG
ncbi:hypothetical protein P280DRAFT_249259 [Massarina eburnea CBS 473.64]|uniref:Uncharacterized protein n=1 Tax=Massarina eburnea CBS 473.64 TaxID=1395130 RepID=A0A6A6S6U2_9PLEO|nr:hypothetical protein P280DRAFT_249259 [Massarina eburnea CBS 473.64]